MTDLIPLCSNCHRQRHQFVKGKRPRETGIIIRETGPFRAKLVGGMPPQLLVPKPKPMRPRKKTKAPRPQKSPPQKGPRQPMVVSQPRILSAPLSPMPIDDWF